MIETELNCEPVIWGATPEEIASQIGRDPNQARVVRPPVEKPTAPPPNPETESVAGYDLTGYYWRRPEAGVAAGGLWGRWFVSLSGSGAVPGTRIRPVPIRLDAGEPLTLKSVLPTGSLYGVLHLSGSEAGGTELLNEWIAAPDTIELLRAARSRNPHISEVGNGRIPSDGAAVLVGCTVPKIPVSLDGLDRTYLAQDDPLWRAGIDRMDWIFGEDGFRPGDVYRQIGWTLTPSAPAVSGSWVEWPWEWNILDPFDYRAGFITPISASIEKWRQPAAGADPIAQNQKRLEGFLTEITEVWNGINRDSNIIRGLQIIGGNDRITQQPARGVRFGAAALPGGGGFGGGTTGGGGGVEDRGPVTPIN